MIQSRSVLPTVIARVLAAILLVGQTEREHFVISGSSDLPITGSPVKGAVHDRWPVDYGAPAREVPEDISVCRVQRAHLSRIRASIHDAVCNTHRTPIYRASNWVCRLPKDFPRRNIKSAPCTPSDLLS